jgi:3D (Asp-Asp-Asp) domain-containing protein
LDTLQKKVEATQKSVDRLNDIEKNTLSRKIISRGGVDRVYRVTQNTLNMSRLLNMRATAYDLSVDSCGKTPSHPEYGITRTGQKVIYKTTVAVDPNTIPLGSVLYIEFPKPYEDMTGIYLAMDTGSAVKKDIIDIYVGKYNPKLCDSFGIQKVKVYLIG